MYCSTTPTYEDKIKQAFISRLNKAKRLSNRLKCFINDMEKSGLFNEKEKREIRSEVLKFLNEEADKRSVLLRVFKNLRKMDYDSRDYILRDLDVDLYEKTLSKKAKRN